MQQAPVHPAAMASKQLLCECEFHRSRRSGPGGQHRNKVETAVVFHHLSTGVKAEATERRSQTENRTVALFRLRVNLALQVRCPRKLDELPSRLWQSRCAGRRINISPSHSDFPAILAEALDVIAAAESDVKRAAEVLGCSFSQLTKLLKKDPRALAQVNDRRRQQGLHPLQ